MITTIREKATSGTIYLIQSVISVIFLTFGIVSFWRGIWSFQDYFILADAKPLSVWSSGVFGILLLSFCIVIRIPLNILARFSDNIHFLEIPKKFRRKNEENSEENENMTNFDQLSRIPNGSETFLAGNNEKPLNYSKKLKKMRKNQQEDKLDSLLLFLNKTNIFVVYFVIYILNLLIFVFHCVVFVIVKFYYLILGITAVLTWRCVWLLWDTYTDILFPEYYAHFIIISAATGAAMMFPFDNFKSLGGVPCLGELFDIYDHKIFPASGYSAKESGEDDDEERKIGMTDGPGSNEVYVPLSQLAFVAPKKKENEGHLKEQLMAPDLQSEDSVSQYESQNIV